jgi:hypothetical protein
MSPAYLNNEFLEIFEAIVNLTIPVVDDDKIIATRAHFEKFQI